jgi:hypothetical protein
MPATSIVFQLQMETIQETMEDGGNEYADGGEQEGRTSWFSSVEPHPHHDRLDGLLDPIPADLRDHLCVPLRLVFDHAVGRVLTIQ